MKKTILIIVLAIIVAALFPTNALAYDSISASGDWEVSYEVNDYGVGASGGTGTLRLKVKNTAPSSSTVIINYVSVSFATGRASEFHQNKSVTIAPTRDRILEFSIPIDASDSGVGLQLWVAMSTGDSDDVDGIGVENGVQFGPDPTYDASCEISTSTTTINRGEKVSIAFGGSCTGNRAVDIKLYDQSNNLIFTTDNMDILYLGKEEYTPTETTTYRFKAKIYKPGTDTLMKEVQSNSITVTVVQPTPEPTEAPTPTPEPTETPIEEAAEVVAEEPGEETSEEETPEQSSELVEEEVSETDQMPLVVDSSNEKNGSSGSNNMLSIVIIVLLSVITLSIIGIIVYLLKTNKRNEV